MQNKSMSELLSLCTSSATVADSYEIVVTKFKDDISHDAQVEAMSRLNDVVSQFDGFKSRDFFYSAEIDRWIDLIAWRDVQSAKKASETLPTNRVAGEVFSLMDESSLLFSHYKRVGGMVANQLG
jgi:hypothetical protein